MFLLFVAVNKTMLRQLSQRILSVLLHLFTFKHSFIFEKLFHFRLLAGDSLHLKLIEYGFKTPLMSLFYSNESPALPNHILREFMQTQ